MEASLAQVGRVFKNVSKQIKEQAQEFMSADTPLEKQLKEATANTNWGCANSILGEIARASFDYHDYNIVMRHVWEALAAKPKCWRKVFKTLTLLEYLVRHGPERVVDEVRDCLFRLKSLSGFHYTDEGRDRGGGIRDKSKQVIDLVSDTELLRSEREKARLNRDRFVGIGAHGEMSGHIGELGGYGNTDLGYTTRHPEYPQTGSTDRSGSFDTRLDQDAEREQQRVVAEREKARKERERQKEKSLRRKSLKEEKPRRSHSKKSEESSSGSSSESSDVAPRRKKKGSEKSAATDLFSTDAGWTSSTSLPSQGFSPTFDAPFATFGDVPIESSTFHPSVSAPSQQTSFYPFPSPIQPVQSHQTFIPQMSFPTQSAYGTQAPQFQVPSNLPSNRSIAPASAAGSQLPHSTFIQPQYTTTQQPTTVAQPPSSVQSLMAQNLAGLSALGPSNMRAQQSSRNPFGERTGNMV